MLFINKYYNTLFFLEEFESIIHFHISSPQCCKNNNDNSNVKYIHNVQFKIKLFMNFNMTLSDALKYMCTKIKISLLQTYFLALGIALQIGMVVFFSRTLHSF